MLQLSRKLINQNGITLVELLVVISLTSIVSMFLITITIKAMQTNQTIYQETVLRDEADIIMSKFFKTIYSLKQEQLVINETESIEGIYTHFLYITNNLSICERDEKGVLKNKTNCKANSFPVGFETKNSITKIKLLNNEVYEITNKGIQICPDSKIIGNPKDTNIYEIELTLKLTNKHGTKKMTFKTEIQPI
ncbi:type II secretory pathway, pseudopilin PulG [Solibacillus silvestris StLB046]|uniref:Type II secretory pathway, pseudopilin PulG n=1 Tax=Solibacillus silvestris (strain StLB046) TaxID=1002809 RepID=F2F452_SOLSS|nr:type II secretory pathway, pseudopilin PulG [Solibacillus silvestris StLB046]